MSPDIDTPNLINPNQIGWFHFDISDKSYISCSSVDSWIILTMGERNRKLINSISFHEAKARIAYWKSFIWQGSGFYLLNNNTKINREITEAEFWHKVEEICANV